ncbi:MAG TPA: M14 family metallopeptidase, partial [Chthonomonadales bacterium]|nr:M14 family metallopeptidase [Chthonomonadales bacterium]
MLPGLFCAALACKPVRQSDWRTTYEKSGYVATGRYQECLDYCERLQRASKFARVIRYGTSPQGRPMIALLISRDGAFTPEKAAQSPKPLVLINNGIHSGEIEGKDASLILAREILISKKEAFLIQGVNLLIVPVFSVDAHERFGPYHRINQNGPKEMGWRANAVNLNLNRDFTKADAVEMRAMLRLLHTWRPDFFFDDHTTDGGDWRYSLMIGVPTGPGIAAPLARWSLQMETAIQPKVEADGFLMAPYFDFFDPSNAARGIAIEEFSPRYSNGYLAAMNRPSMLVETHMLKPYKVRVEATYSVLMRTIQYCELTAGSLKRLVRAADEADRRLAPGAPVTLEAKNIRQSHPFLFKGWLYHPYPSAISGVMTPAWIHTPVDTPTVVFDQYEPSLTLPAPAAYAIPPEWRKIIRLVRLHGFGISTLKRPMTARFSTYRFDNVSYPRQSFESRFRPACAIVPVEQRRTLPAGTAIVRIGQPGARLLMDLLEPQASDSLLRWGLMNAVFEQKEYF